MGTHMASMPSIPPTEQVPSSPTERDLHVHGKPEAAGPKAGHKERFRASLSWALVEYADTLEKLAK
jgi:hypothetical protein